MVSVKDESALVAVTVTVSELSAVTDDLLKLKVETLGMVDSVNVLDALRVPAAVVPVANDAEIDTVPPPLLLWVTVLEYSPRYCALVLLVKLCEKLEDVPPMVILPLGEPLFHETPLP